ncbi:MFS transporter [Micromonospora sp. CA-263727]|uniref:MFS transporter n=1 Tax=Micromonospora sp. CA-263727 TaxID=3239967 RepID=UPI003D9228FE
MANVWLDRHNRWAGIRRTYTVVAFVLLVSLDNVAIGLAPPLYTPISAALQTTESAIGLVTAANILISAAAAVAWAYVGDRANRKLLLITGTLLWTAASASTALADDLGTFIAAQLLGAIGLGAVGSVGFSVVSDLVSPRRRGLAMSLFGLSQGIGTLAGTLVGGILGATDWHRPFRVLAVVGLLAVLLFLPTYNVRRGQSEPDLANMFAAGHDYHHRISRQDLAVLIARRSNVWLVLQGVTAQLTFGSLVWLPRLFQAKAEAQGYPQQTAIVVGAVFATLFQLGGLFSIIGGLVGDRVQLRTPRGRALVAAAGITAGIPFYVLLFFTPVRLSIPPGAEAGAIAASVLGSVLSEPTVAISFVCALLALALTSANAPNWFAMIADVNLPEHRGTVYSAGNLANGIGRAAGNGIVGVVFAALTRAMPAPLNYAVGLALFQVFFIPTAWMYYRASRTTPADIDNVRDTLRARSNAPAARWPADETAAVSDTPDLTADAKSQ